MGMARLLGQGGPPLEVLRHPAADHEVGTRRLALGHTLERVSKDCERAPRGLGVGRERLPVDVFEAIACLMVARIPRLASARVQRRGGDTELDEANVVRVLAEFAGVKVSLGPCKQWAGFIACAYACEMFFPLEARYSWSNCGPMPLLSLMEISYTGLGEPIMS